MKRKKREYTYWFYGMKKPKTIPKDCQLYQDNDGDRPKWVKETDKPRSWSYIPRRWPVEQEPTP